jgi:uncharacterized membrane protein YciS (DUF1049 family)
MGYLLVLSIGFAIGWVTAALFISSAQIKDKAGDRQDKIAPGVEPVCDDCRFMGNV